MITAKDIIENLGVLEEIFLTPVNIKRVGGGNWVVTDSNANKEIGSFSSYAELESFMGTLTPSTLSEDVLDEKDVDISIPCIAVRLQYVRNEPKGQEEQVLPNK
jgi:hypothetical protein